jgi:hypothetical protein
MLRALSLQGILGLAPVIGKKVDSEIYCQAHAFDDWIPHKVLGSRDTRSCQLIMDYFLSTIKMFFLQWIEKRELPWAVRRLRVTAPDQTSMRSFFCIRQKGLCASFVSFVIFVVIFILFLI